jgi:hypothetical protein
MRQPQRLGKAGALKAFGRLTIRSALRLVFQTQPRSFALSLAAISRNPDRNPPRFNAPSLLGHSPDCCESTSGENSLHEQKLERFPAAE